MNDESFEVVNVPRTMKLVGSNNHQGTFCSIEGAVLASDGTQEILAELRRLINLAREATYLATNTAYGFDDNGYIQPTKVEVAARPAAAPAAAGAQTATADIKVLNSREASPDPLPAWLIKAAAADGTFEVFDNRLTATGNQPLFKAGKNCPEPGKGYWAPKGKGKPSYAAKATGPVSQVVPRASVELDDDEVF